jgi:hypothetical protein
MRPERQGSTRKVVSMRRSRVLFFVAIATCAGGGIVLHCGAKS